MNEEISAAQWIKERLETDDEISDMVTGVRLKSVEDRLATPFIKIDRLDASDLLTNNMTRVWVNLTFLVRGIASYSGGDPDWTEVSRIADRIDSLLHRASGVTATVRIGEIFREESYTEEMIETGDLYLHAGGIYRAHVYAL